jgi:hypothetical protein
MAAVGPAMVADTATSLWHSGWQCQCLAQLLAAFTVPVRCFGGCLVAGGSGLRVLLLLVVTRTR